MSYLEELLPEFRKGAKIRRKSWGEKGFIYLKDGTVYDEYGDSTSDCVDTLSIFAKDDWELYQEPIDWDYIIKNKCLCWFWNPGEEDCVMANLLKYYKDDNFPFYPYRPNSHFKNCRPIRRDEVTFYEDKKDEI